jgi:hypothetical protein
MSTFHSVVRDLPITFEVIGSAYPSGGDLAKPGHTARQGRHGLETGSNAKRVLMVKKS